jgi:hypothetical protein
VQELLACSGDDRACGHKVRVNSKMCGGNIFIDGKFLPCHYFLWPHFSNLPLREMLRPFQHSIMEQYDY